MNEQDLRLSLLNTLLTTPHRDLGALYPIHREMIESDPRFYVRLARGMAKTATCATIARCSCATCACPNSTATAKLVGFAA
jgi:hypothetical protein